MSNVTASIEIISQTTDRPWLMPDWDGPIVEVRPEGADKDWPEGAVERVVFTAAMFPDRPSLCRHMPYTEFFGADGWPLSIPNEVRPRLDFRIRMELHRFPWFCRGETWSESDLIDFGSDYRRFKRRQAECAVMRRLTIAAVLPEPEALKTLERRR